VERSDIYLVVLLLAMVTQFSAFLLGGGTILQLSLTVLIVAMLLAYIAEMERQRKAIRRTYEVDELPEWARGEERDWSDR
jgi:hypothetical protein